MTRVTAAAALIDRRTQFRCEAAKTLQTLADPWAAIALMRALDNEDTDVRWVPLRLSSDWVTSVR